MRISDRVGAASMRGVRVRGLSNRGTSLRGPSVRVVSVRGISVIELLAALSVVSIASAIAMASVERDISTAREAGAARAFAMRVRQTRLEAIQRSSSVALQFVTTSSTSSFRAYVDGNGNGVRTREIASGIDPPLTGVAALDDALGGVRFARGANIPAVGEEDDGGAAGSGAGGTGGAGGSGGSGGSGDGGAVDGEGAIRLGTAGLLSFAPMGTGTSGTIYVRGATRQFAVRIYGPTGRVRLLEFEGRARVWVER
jgi:type II secretory pathway pseudopilin PulG